MAKWSRKKKRHLQRCSEKLRIETLQAARNLAWQYKQEFYECDVCGFYHLATRL